MKKVEKRRNKDNESVEKFKHKGWRVGGNKKKREHVKDKNSIAKGERPGNRRSCKEEGRPNPSKR